MQGVTVKTPMHLWVIFLVLLLIGWIFSDIGSAARFDIRPVKIFMEPQTKIEKLIIKNSGGDTLSLQIKVFEWHIDEKGQDRYAETRDIVLFPKMVTLKKDEEKIIRLGTNLRSGAQEKAFRIFVEEIPAGDNENLQGTVIRMQLKVGVPLFLLPLVKDERVELAPVRLDQGKVTIPIRNQGSVHELVQSIRLKGEAASGQEVFSQSLTGWYVLSKSNRNYELSIPQEVCRRIHRLEVKVNLQGDKTLKEQFTVDGGRCNRAD